ncbi:MAG: VRR-NUC domain-containing protein [Bdellovibrionaceae bacterium]|nr:VRR-NUC domain-containing protein [Pseudobdellovibrionaceae bacterium]
MLPVLPPKYYLDHFRDLLGFLRRNAWELCEERERGFIEDFEELSEDAQCLVVRMLNRKGRLFRADDLRYAEITDAARAWPELERTGFVQGYREGAVPNAELAAFLGKSELQSWLRAAGVEFKKSAGKAELVARASALGAPAVNGPATDVLVQGRGAEIEYLLFLYFGKIQRSLSLYTLRDLGIRRVREARAEYRPRFQDREDARAHYFFAAKVDLWNRGEADPAFQVQTLAEWPVPRSEAARELRESLLVALGQYAEAEGRADDALRFFELCAAHPGNERRVRLLHKMGRVDEARQELDRMIARPGCDEELLFAEDFLARKYEGKRRGFLSEALHSARELQVSESYLGKPELGVRDHLKREGIESVHTENDLWNALFALSFWDELLNADDAAIHNPFERAPQDLGGAEFYARFRERIETRLSDWDQPRLALARLLETLKRHEGETQDLLRWHPGLAPLITDFVTSAAVSGRGAGIANVLRAMARSHADRRSGFPDLVVFGAEGPRFIEVKSEGDAIKARQLSQMRLLRESGFDVEILRVNWAPDPAQAYVVVDVETTGAGGTQHRVTEIGAVKIVDGRVVDEFQTRLNPGRSIPSFITKLTGISNAMVADAPRFAEVADRFEAFTDGAIFAAHNARFDYGFIQSEFARLDRAYVRPTFCTCQNARKFFPKLESHGLKNLCQHFGIDLESHHRALCDAKAAAEVLLRIQAARWGAGEASPQNIKVTEPETSRSR